MTVWVVYRDDFDGESSTITIVSAWTDEAAARAEVERKNGGRSIGSWSSYDLEEVDLNPE